jgi:hypothetical protein
MGRPRRGAMAKQGSLIVCGLGIHFPYQISVESLAALSHCDEVFTNAPGTEAMEFLRLFCKVVRPLHAQWRGAEKLRGRPIIQALEAGKKVGFVTRGHPLLFGGIAYYLMEWCEKRGLPCRAYGAISSMDVILAASRTCMGQDSHGFQLLSTKLLVEEALAPNPRLPLFLYMGLSDGTPGRPKDVIAAHLAKLQKALSAAYGAAHRLNIYGPPYKDALYEGVAVSALLEAFKDIGVRSVTDLNIYALVLPPKGSPNGRSGKPRRRASLAREMDRPLPQFLDPLGLLSKTKGSVH